MALLEWIRERWALVVLAFLVGIGGLWWWSGRPLSQPPGFLAMEDPVQTPPDPTASWTFRYHKITPLARFEIHARVLSRERYRFDRASELSTLDLALGWGPMSDTRILDAFSIQQRDRWYFWSAARMPIPESEVIGHSANMHMIPATKVLDRRLLRVRAGQMVRLRGQLVRVDGRDGWHWVSSLSRTDTGDGSCEVVWVEAVEVSDR